ncbi:OprD family outer membrane porin, partial [Sulfuricurvum sp.]|uniref:OprD family outer membrane porin n=1 Tax=Sulfuricurvum sp. TaxID=2025608 RepID=UPI0025FA72B5
VNVAYYLTTDFGLRSSNPRKTDAYMFDVDKRPYSILGEAALEYKRGDSTLLFGRQEIDTPIVSTYDYRIIPNLFEAYTYTNKNIENTAITLSYITKMSGLDGLVSFKHFESMSQQTYTSLAMSDINTVDSNGGDTLDISRISGDQGVLMSGIVYESGVKIQGWNYYCKDVLDEFYVDMAYPYPLNENLNAIVEIQGYGVRETGRFKNFLQNLGLNGSYELFGTKLSLENKELGLTASLAYNLFTGDAKTITAFGNWGGYPEYVAIPYMFAQDGTVSALAKSRMGKISLKYDLAKLGLAKQTLIGGYSLIDLDESIMPHSDIHLINLVYKAKIYDAFSLKVQYELRQSDNYRYADDMLTLSTTYRF